MNAALKAAGDVVGRYVVSAQFDAQGYALGGECCAGQGHVVNMNLVALCLAVGQKQGKGAA